MDLSPTKATEQFLKCVAIHLANRAECKGLIYRLTIHQGGLVEFYPSVRVCPSRYIRKKESMDDVIHHVLTNHDIGQYIINTDMTVRYFPDCYVRPERVLPGQYIYQKSFTSARRTWIAV